jgi:hypothetical protein
MVHPSDCLCGQPVALSGMAGTPISGGKQGATKMRTMTVVSAAAAAVVALTLFDATSSDAAVKGRSVTARSVQRAPSRSAQPRVHKQTGNSNKSFVKKSTSSNQFKKGTSSNTLRKSTSSSFVKKSTIGGGTLNLRRLPLHKAAAGNQFLKARLAVPQNIKPKLTLTHSPSLKFRPRFAPFVQRHWKKAFFWVAVAGIGYLTIPELYYSSFYSCVSVDDPIWDDCSYILSYAALEEEEVVRVSMPANTKYRYTLKTAAKPSDCPSCQWDRFVERKWNQSYAWVKLPEVGNITVPDAYYDRFYTYAGANPPNYPQACKVLEDAAAVTEEKEVARISMPSDTEFRYEAANKPTQECKSCTLEPFVERKWNKEYVWVQVPQTGNVTVPEDSYDRFYGYASAEPPNYPAACKVLVEAAAVDTVMTTSLDTSREEQ